MIRPNVFSEAYIIPRKKYTVTLCFDEDLNPSSVTEEYFTIAENGTGKELTIANVLYKPASKQVVLTVGPEQLVGLNCTTTLKKGLMYLDGTSLPEDEVVVENIIPEYMCSVDGVSIKNLLVYTSGVSCVRPKANVKFSVKVVVINATDRTLTRQIKLYKNDEVSICDGQETIIPAYGTVELVFNDLIVSEWNEDDELTAGISELAQ